ncbi:MAG: hypothetical protein AB7K08_11670 [Microbacteriaceae bacterium]
MKLLTRPKRDRNAPPESTPCRSCGLGVKHPDPSRADSIEVFVEPSLSRANIGVPSTPVQFAATRCDECDERRDLAALLLAEHPRVRRAHGMVAIDRLDAALAALDAGGIRGGRATAPFTSTDAAVFDLIESLAALGGAASWSLAPRREGNARRWSHLDADTRAAIAAEIRATVHRRYEFPMPFVPPGATAGGDVLPGCLMCGRGTLTVKESEAREAWGDLHRIEVVSLGGRTRADPVSGYFCPRCRFAIEKEGAPGMPANQRAVLAHFGYELRIGFRLNMTTVRGWAALPLGTAPNSKPWAHLDLGKLRRKFEGWEERALLVRSDRA